MTDILNSLDKNKALGPDGVSPTLLPISAIEIAFLFTKLFKLSIKKRKVSK